ncbi:hypothetical protein PS876_00039 [Pseudomonas fluorescens]|nr:hypothetical protein PS876_00039 [Pseudomonas fluorescens]
MPAIAAGQVTLMLDVLAPSRASSLPQGFAMVARFVSGTNHCGSGLARDGGGSGDIDVGSAGPLREQARSHRDFAMVARFVSGTNHCGSGLVRDGGGSGDIDVGCAGPFASKLAPTGFCGGREVCVWHNSLWERAFRDGGGSGDIDVGSAGPFASKLAPTGFCGGRKVCVWHKSLWERACPRWRRVRRL